jgi:O-antigen/teichoic acid export membrane protein
MLVRPALFTVVVGGVFLAGARVDAAFVMVLFLVSALVTAAVQFALLRGVFAAAGGPRDTSPWRSWLGTGLALLPMIVMRENLRDLLIASAALGLAAGEVALFVIAIAVTGILTFSVKAVDLSFGPRVARAYADGHAARCRRLLAGGSGLKALIFLAGAAVLVAFRHDVLAIVGGEYVAASTAVVVLLLIPLAEALAGPVNILLTVSGHGRVILAVSLGGAAGIALATPVAGALHGVEAAALAAGACYLVHQLALLVMCWRRVGIDPSILSLRHVLARHHHGGRDGG